MSKRKPSGKAIRLTKSRTKTSIAVPGQDGVGDIIMQSAAFLRATAGAEACVRDSERLRKLFSDAMEKINYVPRGPFAETWPYLLGMVRLIRSYHRKEYQDISSQHL